MNDLGTRSCRFGLACVVLVLGWCAAAAAGEAALSAASVAVATVESHIVPMRAPDAPEWRLPAGCVVEQEDGSGTTWRQWGHLDVSPAGARSEMAKALGAQGWRRERLLPFAVSGSELQIWRRGPRQILVMMWPQALGRTGFAWGPANAAGPGGAPVVPALPGVKDDALSRKR